MNNKNADQDTFRTLQLMNEIESGDAVSQRELAGRLGIAVGLVNSHLKNFVSKGLVRVKNYPRNRYAYLLTPKGFAEKSRLAYQHLNYFNNLFTVVREDYRTLFQQLLHEGCCEVVFCGVDEVAEIAYLSMRESGLRLVSVIDDADLPVDFFGHKVLGMAYVKELINSAFVITSMKRKDHLIELLLMNNVAHDRIHYP